MVKPAKQKQVVSKQGRKRMTRSQTVDLEDKTVALEEKIVTLEDITVAKGNLEDILHAIDIEETPIVQAEDIEEGGKKTKESQIYKETRI